MILAFGARGPGFKSRTGPFILHSLVFYAYLENSVSTGVYTFVTPEAYCFKRSIAKWIISEHTSRYDNKRILATVFAVRSGTGVKTTHFRARHDICFSNSPAVPREWKVPSNVSYRDVYHVTLVEPVKAAEIAQLGER